jgi:hypothetical protein
VVRVREGEVCIFHLLMEMIMITYSRSGPETRPGIRIMSHIFRVRRILLVAAAALFAALQFATASVIGTVVANPGGTWSYAYTVDNSGGAFDIASWSLDLSIPAADWNPLEALSGGDVSVPDPGWFADAGVPVAGGSAQDFLSLSPASDVARGSTLAGFSFTSSFAPGPATYFEFSATGGFVRGATVGPAAGSVPEGGGWLAGLAALALVAFGRATRGSGCRSQVA